VLLPGAVSPESDMATMVLTVTCDLDALECRGYRRRITEGDLFRSPDPKNAPCDGTGNSIEIANDRRACCTDLCIIAVDEKVEMGSLPGTR
jgi:hypothetical protein